MGRDDMPMRTTSTPSGDRIVELSEETRPHPSPASGSGAGRRTSARRLEARRVGYWLATAVVAAELALGGAWDIARIPDVREGVTTLGYPTYFLVLLGIWKVLGAMVLLLPRLPVLKEWTYAGAFFVYTGAIVSHLTTGYQVSEVGILSVLTALTMLSWALRPPTRRTTHAPAP